MEGREREGNGKKWKEGKRNGRGGKEMEQRKGRKCMNKEKEGNV